MWSWLVHYIPLVFSFIEDHWALIGWIISELFGLLPGRYNGVLHLIWKILVRIFGEIQNVAYKAQRSKFNS